MKSRIVTTLVCTLTALSAQVPAPMQSGIALQATELLPAELLRGTSYRVRDLVVTDGFMAHFTIDSDFGTFEAVGVPQAKKRIGEVAAIRTLVETSKGDLFAEGLKRSVEQPIDAVKNIISHPVDSVKAAPKTVGHFFSKIGSSVSTGFNKVKDSTSGDGPQPTAGEIGSGIGNAAKNAAGFDKAKLDTARQLGVDPYSDNPRLQEEMDKVTWAFFAGGLPLRVGAAVASAGVAVAATNMVGIPGDTYALTQGELLLRDGRSLAEMGITDEDIYKFKAQPTLSTTRRHQIVTALEALPKTRGRGRVILLANACETADQADFLIGALEILARQQKAGAADYASIEVIGRLPAAMTTAGELHVAAPVDFVTWTEQVAGFSSRDDLGQAPRVLLHTGKIAPPAAEGLKAAGWSLLPLPY
ncbi:MAG: hypothetical protein V4640_05250 [Verrucomicrobiota bacterium]